MLGLHPWLNDDPLGGSLATAESRGQIHRAALVLGMEHVSGSAYEWTRFRDPDGLGVIEEFAALMQGEMLAVLDHQRRRQAHEHTLALQRARAVEDARQARTRREVAAALLLLG